MLIAEFTNEQLPDLKLLLNCALNTWDKAPAWAWELDARVTQRIASLKEPAPNFEDVKRTTVL